MTKPVLRAILADRDISFLKILDEVLKGNFPEIKIVDHCTTVDQAMVSIRIHHPDLLFLDSDLPEQGGFALLRLTGKGNFRVIILSEITDHAVEAFRYSATDYLLKPIDEIRLAEAMARIENEMEKEHLLQKLEKQKRKTALTEALNNGNLVISNTKGFTVVKMTDIILCEAAGYCTSFYLKGKAKLSSSRNLKYYENLLPGNAFMRVHNSFIINTEQVQGYSNEGEIQLSENLRCPVSKVHKQGFLRLYKKTE